MITAEDKMAWAAEHRGEFRNAKYCLQNYFHRRVICENSSYTEHNHVTGWDFGSVFEQVQTLNSILFNFYYYLDFLKKVKLHKEAVK